LKAGELVGKLDPYTLHKLKEDEDAWIGANFSGGIFPVTDRPTDEQLQAEKETRMKLFPGTKYDEYNSPEYGWIKEKQAQQKPETLECVSEGLLYMEEANGFASSFLQQVENLQTDTVGSETLQDYFQESLLDADLQQQFVNLQGTNPSIIHAAEPKPTTD
jgi:hypothetical protein